MTAPAAGSPTQPLRVALTGAYGRMGSLASDYLSRADGVEVVARLGSADPIESLADSAPQVLVDLTRPDAVMSNVRYAIEHGIHCVIGTSGVGAESQRELRALLAQHPEVGVVLAPNFAVGAVLAMRFAAEAARYFDAVEVIELHHAGKADAPSGTAAATAARIAQERAHAGSAPMPDATAHDADGARGAEVDGVHVHSVRLPGLVAHQEVLLGNPGELLTIRHDSTDRASFMPGVLLATRQAPLRPGLTIGLEPLLGLPAAGAANPSTAAAGPSAGAGDPSALAEESAGTGQT